MGFENCDIQLDNQWRTYYAGETLSGQIKLNLQNEKKVRGELSFWNSMNFYWSVLMKFAVEFLVNIHRHIWKIFYKQTHLFKT